MKIKLILASMFFCSVIFAQENSPAIQPMVNSTSNNKPLPQKKGKTNVMHLDLNKSVSLTENSTTYYEKTTLANYTKLIYKENKLVLDQMKYNDIERYKAFVHDLQSMELNELKSLYNLK